MKTKRIVYWVATSLLALTLFIGGLFPLIDSSHAVEEYAKLGYPTYLVPLIGVAKLLALVVILHSRYKKLVEWAYAGLFYDFLLAFIAHYQVGDGEHFSVLFPLFCLALSYRLKDQVRV